MSLQAVLDSHGPNVEECFVFGSCVYMIIEEYNLLEKDSPQYAVKINDLDMDLVDDGIWLTINGNSRFYTISGALRAILTHIEDSLK